VKPISDEQLAVFNEQGYLVVEGLLDPQHDLDPIIREYEGVLNHLADELHAAGSIASTYADLPFGERVTRIYGESGRVHAQYFDFSLPQGGVKEDTPFWTGPAVFSALTNPKLLDAVECFIGPEIYSNPVQHVRIKPPERLTPINPDTGLVQLGVTPWHQDNGVVLPEADDTRMLTVWFPLTDASVEQGCLVVVPQSHRRGLLHHCPGKWGLEVPEPLFHLSDGVPLPMRRGDVLFMNKLTIHSSLSNKSNQIRWSFDLRYNPIGQPTGRGAFPGFVARSQANPETELHNPEEWTRLWLEARHAMANGVDKPFNRWRKDHPVCA
jgi:ectoine hydroxylase-related dioxygenase (phytanoyl-CoA dioxygenase family)